MLALLLALPVAALPRPAAAQELVPRVEDAELPAGGAARVRIQPFVQAWHREFSGGAEVPLRADFDGPLLDHLYPGRQTLVADLNDAAPALGFDPVPAGGASLGSLDVEELAVNVRGVLAEVEVGLLDRVAVNLAVPVLRSEVEPFSSYDPTGATLAPATAAVPDGFGFLEQVSAARQALRQQIEGGGLTAQEEEQARALLDASGAFASTLEGRLAADDLLPLAGTTAGDQMLAHLSGLRSGFADFGLSVPPLGLAPDLTAAGLAGTVALPLREATRGWLAGETELGVRVLALDAFADTPEESGGLEARTTLGVRVRLPFRSANAAPFVRPFDVLGVPLGDGQRDLVLSLYQDVRIAGDLLVNTSAHYGLQRSDRLLMRVRAPDLPFTSAPLQTMERDLGDYLRARVSPRLVLNRFLSVGAEYRYWRKGADSYRIVGEEPGDASALEARTEQTRHRLGAGAFYRPAPAEEDESRGAVPELGLLWQTALSGSGGETPAAGLVTFYVQLPFRVF